MYGCKSVGKLSEILLFSRNYLMCHKREFYTRNINAILFG